MTHCIKNAKVEQFLGLPTPRSKRMLSSYLASSAIYFKNIIGAKLTGPPLFVSPLRLKYFSKLPLQSPVDVKINDVIESETGLYGP